MSCRAEVVHFDCVTLKTSSSSTSWKRPLKIKHAGTYCCLLQIYKKSLRKNSGICSVWNDIIKIIGRIIKYLAPTIITHSPSLSIKCNNKWEFVCLFSVLSPLLLLSVDFHPVSNRFSFCWKHKSRKKREDRIWNKQIIQNFSTSAIYDEHFCLFCGQKKILNKNVQLHKYFHDARKGGIQGKRAQRKTQSKRLEEREKM